MTHIFNYFLLVLYYVILETDTNIVLILSQKTGSGVDNGLI